MGTFIRDKDAGYLTFDNVLSEDFTLPAIVTSVPIQTTAAYTDHRQQQQTTVRIRGLITETPIEEFLSGDALSETMYSAHRGDEFGAGFDGDFSTIGALEGMTGVAENLLGLRSRMAVAFWTIAQHELLTYFSRRLGFWRNLLVTDVTFGVTKRHDIVFQIEAVQVEFSESRRVDMPPLRTVKAKPATCPTTNVGQRATEAKDANDLTLNGKLMEFGFGTRGAPQTADALQAALSRIGF